MKNFRSKLMCFCIGCIALLYWGSSPTHADAFDALKDAVKQNTKTPAELEKLCEADDAISCVVLGSFFYRGIGVEKNPGKADTLIRKACDIGNLVSCLLLAFFYLYPFDGFKRDVPTARSLLDENCQKSHALSCHYSGFHFWGFYLPRGEKPNVEEAEKYLEKACNLGVGESCILLSEVFGTNQLIKKDIKRSKGYYDRACSLFKQKDAKAFNSFCYLKCVPKEKRHAYFFFGAWSTNNFCEIM